MASLFHLWSALGPFFVTGAGQVDGQDWGTSDVADGGTPIWVETYTPSASYAPGAALNYTVVLTTQDWLGDIQPLVTFTTDANFIDPFGNGPTTIGNIAAPVIFSTSATTGSGGLVYWKASATPGDYALVFQPLTVTYPAAPTLLPLTQLTGSPVTMISAIANPLGWNYSSHTTTSMVFAYTTAASPTTENLYFEGFDNNGAATNSGPVLIAAGLPRGDPFFIGYNSSGYGYRYLEVGGALGTGLVGGTFNTSTGALGSPSLFLSLPTFTSFSNVISFGLSTGNSLRFIEGVSNGQAVIQGFLNGNTSPTASYALSSTSDRSAATAVYDPNTGNLDYIALAYADAGAVHLELLNENGNQIGSDLIVPGISSFDRLHTLAGNPTSASTRVELDYTVADPNGGYEVEGYIFDTSSARTYTLSGGGLYIGSTFDDSITWGAGVYTVDGGGGSDTLVATNLSSSQVTLKIDATGETVLSDGSGDVDTLRRFTTIDLSNATVTISGRRLTQLNSDGTKVATTFTSAGKVLSVRNYNSSGRLVELTYPTEIPNDFTGDNRSDIVFEKETGQSASSNGLTTWQMNDTAITGSAGYGASIPLTFEGSGDFDGNGYSDLLQAAPGGGLQITALGPVR